jgi:hypothetical protein
MTKAESKFYYFKVSENILEADIKKSELWVYLTHCRSRGIYSKGYSIAGLNAVIKIFSNKINKKVYDKSIKGLQDKGLIEISDTEVKKGLYKSNEVIKVIDGKRNIQLPIELLDKKIITNLSVDEVKDIIKLYSLYDPLGSLGGIDYNYLYASYNNREDRGIEHITNFGGGFSRVIKGKRAYRVLNHKYYNTDLGIDINKYMKLFKLKPVILEYDKDDEDLTELRGEVFKDLVRFSKKELNYEYITTMEDNHKIIWVYEPVYPVKNKQYFEYMENRERAYNKALEIYKSFDRATDEDNIKDIIYNKTTDLSIFLSDEEIYNRQDIEADKIHDLLIMIRDRGYTIDTIEGLEHERELILYEIAKEKDFIESENIRISKEENRRRRHTTSPRLKELKNNLSNIDNEINQIKSIENNLIKLIPPWIIDRILVQDEGRY